MISQVMNLANGIIGVSVLAMPFCFKQCGIVLATLVLLLSSILSKLACHFLIKSAVMSRRRNFEILAFHAFGPMGKFLVELCIIGFLLGTCTAYFVVVGDLGPQIVGELINKTPGDIRTSFLITTGIFIILPLGLLRNIDSLASVSTASIAFYLCLVLRIIAESAHHIFAADWFDKIHYWRPSGILQCLPIFALALFCQTQLFEIYEVVPNATLEKMNQIVRGALNICTTVYFCVGLFGYIAFCNQPFTGNILMSFEPSFVSEVIKIGFVLSVAFSFPLVIFPCRASLNSLLFKRGYAYESSTSYISEARFRCLTTFIVIVALTVGVLIPSIEFVLGIVGSTIGVMICLIFPAAFFIAISTKNTSERLLAQLLLIIGIWIMILGTYANLYAMEQSSNLQTTVVITKPPSQINNMPNILINNEMLIRPNNPKPQEELINIKDDNVDDKLKLKAPDQPLNNENQRKEPPVPEDNSKRKRLPIPIDETKWNKALAIDENKPNEPSVVVEESKPNEFAVVEEENKLKENPAIIKENKLKVPSLSIEENKRQEPPIPVERLSENQFLKKEQEKIAVKSVTINSKIQEIVDKIKDDQLIKEAEVAYNSLKKVKETNRTQPKPQKNLAPIEESDKIDLGPKNDVIAVDAIKKEELELAADRDSLNADSLQRREQLDITLKKHIMEQKELLQEQKELIKDLTQKQKELNLVDTAQTNQEKDQGKDHKTKIDVELEEKIKLNDENEITLENNNEDKNEEIEDTKELQPEIKRNIQKNNDGQKVIQIIQNVNDGTSNKVLIDIDKKSEDIDNIQNIQAPNNKLKETSHSNLNQLDTKLSKLKDPIIQALTKQSNKISNLNDVAETHIDEKNNINIDKNDKYSVPIVLKLTNQTKQVLDAKPLSINQSNPDVGILSRDILENHQRDKRMVEEEEIGIKNKINPNNDLKGKSETEKEVCSKTELKSIENFQKEKANKINDLNDSLNLIKTNSYLSDQVFVNDVSIDPILNIADNFVKVKSRDLKAIKSENDDKK